LEVFSIQPIHTPFPKTQIKKIKLENKELLPLPWLDQTYYSKKERKTREWGTKGNKFTRLGARCTKAIWPPANRGAWSINHSISSLRSVPSIQMQLRHAEAY